MSKFKLIFKLASKLGPAVVVAVMRYGPQIRQILKDNPEVLNRITGQFNKMAKLQEKKKVTTANLAERCNILLEQVTYLYASANTADVAQQATQWRKELENIARSLPLLDVMSKKQRVNEMRRLNKKIDDLSSDILAASLIDDVEDAEFTEEK